MDLDAEMAVRVRVALLARPPSLLGGPVYDEAATCWIATLATEGATVEGRGDSPMDALLALERLVCSPVRA